MRERKSVRSPGKLPEVPEDPSREAVETMIDEISEQSFPASDPPAWGVIRARLDRAEEQPD
jgi:hypothetical protein